MSTKCVHNWEFANGTSHLFCTECNETIDGEDIIERLSDLHIQRARAERAERLLDKLLDTYNSNIHPYYGPIWTALEDVFYRVNAEWQSRATQ